MALLVKLLSFQVFVISYIISDFVQENKVLSPEDLQYTDNTSEFAQYQAISNTGGKVIFSSHECASTRFLVVLADP